MSKRLIRQGVAVACVAALLAVTACGDRPPPAVRSSVTPGAASPAASATASIGPSTPTATPTATATVASASYRDATYEVSGRLVALKNGVLEVEAAPGSASKVTTRVFGNEATGDLNGDGVADVAFVLTQSPGGSGTFYYAVAALKTATGYAGTNAVLLGDRIAPQTTAVENGTVVVNYADRQRGEAMTTAPSVGVSKWLKVTNGRLVEVPRP